MIRREEMAQAEEEMRRFKAPSLLVSLFVFFFAGLVAAKPRVKPATNSSAVPVAPAGTGAGGIDLDAGAAAATGPEGGAGGTVGGCVESIPSGAVRPTLTEYFPMHGLSGYAATLRVVVDHGRGESVLPRGLDLQSESEAAKALKSAGFVLPDQDGGGAARLSANPPDAKHPERASTTLELPLLALPTEPGRHTLVLPPLPVAVARANGEIATACTKEHSIVIEDPTSSIPDAKPKPNPSPRVQREEWTLMRQVVTYAAIGIVLGIAIALLVRKWLSRPKPVRPPPPPRPPWEIALEKLDEVRHAGLLEVARFQEYFDRVNDAVRAYLGARYDFDGLESTTDEILVALRRAVLERHALAGILEFLGDCDLVKFANMTPSKDECERTLDSAERIVRMTMPLRPLGSSPMLEVDSAPDAPPGPPENAGPAGPAPAQGAGEKPANPSGHDPKPPEAP
jgi:hypothetical protein